MRFAQIWVALILLLTAASAQAFWVCRGLYRNQDIQALATEAIRILDDLEAHDRRDSAEVSEFSRKLQRWTLSENELPGKAVIQAQGRLGGLNNAGIYSYRVGNFTRLIKVLDHFAFKLFAKEIRNAVLIANSGGPQIHGVGIVTVHQKSHYYLEMEWMDAEAAGETYKNSYFSGLGVASFLKHDFPAQAAKLWVRAFENGAIPADIDFMLLKSGVLRWIDSGEWSEFISPAQLHAESFRPYRVLYRQLEKVDPAAARALHEGVLREIRQSPRLSTSVQAALLENLNGSLTLKDQ